MRLFLFGGELFSYGAGTIRLWGGRRLKGWELFREVFQFLGWIDSLAGWELVIDDWEHPD